MATSKKATTKKKQEKRTGEPALRIAASLEQMARMATHHSGWEWEPETGEPAQRIAHALEALAYGPPSMAETFVGHLEPLSKPEEGEGQGEGAAEGTEPPTGL